MYFQSPTKARSDNLNAYLGDLTQGQSVDLVNDNYDFTARISFALGIPIATGPLDGGTHKSFCMSGDDVFKGLTLAVEFLKTRKPDKILSVSCYKVLSVTDGAEIFQWKVRCI